MHGRSRALSPDAAADRTRRSWRAVGPKTQAVEEALVYPSAARRRTRNVSSRSLLRHGAILAGLVLACGGSESSAGFNDVPASSGGASGSGTPGGSGGTSGPAGGTGGGAEGGSGGGVPNGCETCAEATCVDLQSDPAHCGECAIACGPSEVCNQGVCQAGGCGALTQCGQACIDTATNSLHCGECDAACGADQQCVGGACTCLDARAVCGGVCVDTDFDPNHCGGCGQACDAGEGCTAGQCGCGSDPATFSADVLPILTAQCSAPGCHSGMRPQADLSLTASTAYASLVGGASVQCSDGRLRVAPGDPAGSYLMDKLLGIDLCSGTRMPKTGQSLSAAELSAISAWICAGALND